MGVHGLWRLLDSFGTVIQPDHLKGKRVAIDASIWIAQFRARIAPGEDVEHKVLEGFLARILKLLFYGIKPVFVFDGQASATKGAEHYRRMRQRAINARALLKRRAKEILMAQVAAGAIDLEGLKNAAQAGAKTQRKSAVGNAEVAPVAAAPTPHDTAAVASTLASYAASRAVEGNDSCATGASFQTDGKTATPAAPHHHKKRRRGDACPTHRYLPCPRRHRLAPDAVASRSTLHFLRDVEGLLEERSKHEALVVHNALQNTSTSLFMGPRRAVEDDTSGETTAQPTDASLASPQNVFVVEDGDPVQAEQVEEEIISVTDSSADDEGVDEERVDPDSSVTSTSLLSPSDSGTVSCHSGESVVQIGKRKASSRSPSSVSGNTAVLHSGDLARFLTTLSQLTPPSEPQPVPAHPTEKPAGDNVALNTEEVNASKVAPTMSIDSDDGTDDETGQADEASASDEEAWEESSSDSWDDEEEEERNEGDGEADTSTNAVSMTWEPFTQRIDPALLLHHLSTSQGPSQHPTVTPPRNTDAASAGLHKNEDCNDADFTPVKLGRGFSVKQAQSSVVVVVNSSDEDETGNPLANVPCPHVSDGNRESRVCTAGTDCSPDTRFNPLATSVTTSPAAASTSATAARRTNPARSTVAVVPFELLHVVELLDCCGVPYVLSPTEADAQCAFLARNGLVDAVFTEDSDVLVHGATTVLRGFFSQSKNVVAYKQAELAACGITKTVLVALASLLGCDYTDGVPGIGLVGALEALVVAWTPQNNREENADSPLAVLHVLRRWRDLVRHPPQSWHDVDDETTMAQFALFNAAISQWHLLEQRPSFPEVPAVEAFFIAEVDADMTPFTWLPPDWQQIRVFAGAWGALSSGRLVQRYELARKEWLKRETEAAAAQDSAGQRRLTEYGAQERMRAEWAYQKQPRRHAALLAQLRAVQLLA
jgi:DNA excision repair protein ERCC-5